MSTRSNVVGDYATVLHLLVLRLKGYSSKGVTIVNVIIHQLGHSGTEVALTALVAHVCFDCSGLELETVVLGVTLPAKPVIVREQGTQVVRVQVVPDLTQLWCGGTVLPWEYSVRGCLGISGEDVVTQLLPLVNLTTTLVIILIPQPANPCTLIILS
ncbi:hypothetical protein D3C71_479910 [compost metagenome]